MPITHQVDLQHLKAEFDERCEKLRHVLIGSSPNRNVFDQYSLNPDDFKRDFIELDEKQLLFAIEDLQTCLKKLKQVSKLRAPRLASK
jgi:hypothetical protein